ncbi:MAG: isopeptide-forming domain-containing fimbrial protein, partial [Phoenicibacter congonensis]|nr:isopeptide-forming domain-containing fimbrial protein [Phoenicibacter congonensis]
MKKMKKLFAFVAAVATCLALGATSVNADESTYSVTITNATGTYEIYQVFSGELAVANDDKILSNVQWGKDVNAFTYTTKDATATEAAASSDKASEIAEYLATKSDDSTVAKDFAKKAIANVKTNPASSSGTATATDGTATFTGLSAGYYVVKNTSVGDSETYTRYILQVVGNVTVENKASVPSFEKKVKDTNDSTGATSDWQDSADYDIGDEVPFQLTGTVASTYDSYKQYYFAFHDVEENGLTFKEIKSVYVLNGETKTELATDDYS